jgi:hypothetical protein
MQIFKATNTLDGYLPEFDYTADKAAAELILVGGKKFDLGEFPGAAAYLDRLRSRPSYLAISPATSLAESSGRP